jgi:hypothetical protein
MSAVKPVGVAVGSQQLKLVLSEAEESMEVGYDVQGVAAIVSLCKENLEFGKRPALVAGNRRWAQAVAYALQKEGVEVRYFGGQEKGRGQKADGVKVLKKALEKGFSGQPFFRKESENGESAKLLVQEEASHPWVMLASEYGKTNDDIRRAKHRILDCLRVLSPELLTLEDKLWQKKSLEAMGDGKWQYFLEFGVDCQKSVGQNVPAEKREEAAKRLKENIPNLAEAEGRKAEVKDKIARQMDTHPVATHYNLSFSSMMVALLVGWRDWADRDGKWNQAGWRRLRGYAGLAVTRMDAKGKMRISRKRPSARVNLFHLLKTTRGKTIVARETQRLKSDPARQALRPEALRERLRRTEQLEYILKDIWGILRDAKVSIGVPS